STIINALDLTTFFNYKNPSAAIAQGFISIPEDGIYRFSTDVDQLYINNQLIISNEGELKKHSRNDASMALAKGFHGVRLVALNNVFRGWPMAWSGIQVWCKKSDDEKLQKINTFYHQH
ncbi:MAG: PA14 domain-containing protein, partial [Salinivirgaceae bacterium]|nr:PA14 domain-containing protein [Salinivirgaceae bacterium]